jgi:hypothetical protein
MTTMAPLTHLCFVMADALDRTCDEMPETVCKEQRLVLTGLARAFQIAGDQLKAEQAERERKLEVPFVHGHAGAR